MAPDDAPDRDDDAPEDALLARAAFALRESTDHGWVRARSGFMERALWALRPSTGVNGLLPPAAPSGQPVPFVVQSSVVVAQVRAVLDHDPAVRPERLVCHTDRDGTLTGLSVVVAARYGEPLVPLAQQVRATCARMLRSLLGLPDLPDSVVSVDVCVTDVFPAG